MASDIYELTFIDYFETSNKCIFYITINNKGQIIISKKNKNLIIDVILWNHEKVNTFNSLELLNEFLLDNEFPTIHYINDVSINCKNYEYFDDLFTKN